MAVSSRWHSGRDALLRHNAHLEVLTSSLVHLRRRLYFLRWIRLKLDLLRLDFQLLYTTTFIIFYEACGTVASSLNNVRTGRMLLTLLAPTLHLTAGQFDLLAGAHVDYCALLVDMGIRVVLVVACVDRRCLSVSTSFGP